MQVGWTAFERTHPVLFYSTRHFIGRLGQLIMLLFGISTALFLVSRLTGDPALVLAGEGATPDRLAAVRHLYGLDQPLPVQYLTFLGQGGRLNFGDSMIYHTAAMGLVMQRLPNTLLLAFTAMSLNIVLAVLAGSWLGSRPQRGGRRIAGLGVIVMQGIPAFVLALILIEVFAVSIQILPSIGNQGLQSLFLPAISLAWFLFPRAIRLVSTKVQSSMGQTYVRTARASGASFWEVLWRHALPNSLLAATAFLGVQFAYLLSGSLVIETIFAWNGIGSLLVDAVRLQDFPIVEAAVFVVAILVFAVNTAVDLLLPAIDPRLRSGR